MSAFDIAGAVTCAIFAIVIWDDFLAHPESQGKSRNGFIAIVLSLASAFCIARLFGAHL